MVTFVIVFVVVIQCVDAGALGRTYNATHVSTIKPIKYHFLYGINNYGLNGTKTNEFKKGDKVLGEYVVEEADGSKKVIKYSKNNERSFEAVVNKLDSDKLTPESEDSEQNECKTEVKHQAKHEVHTTPRCTKNTKKPRHRHRPSCHRHRHVVRKFRTTKCNIPVEEYVTDFGLDSKSLGTSSLTSTSLHGPITGVSEATTISKDSTGNTNNLKKVIDQETTLLTTSNSSIAKDTLSSSNEQSSSTMQDNAENSNTIEKKTSEYTSTNSVDTSTKFSESQPNKASGVPQIVEEESSLKSAMPKVNVASEFNELRNSVSSAANRNFVKSVLKSDSSDNSETENNYAAKGGKKENEDISSAIIQPLAWKNLASDSTTTMHIVKLKKNESETTATVAHHEPSMMSCEPAPKEKAQRNTIEKHVADYDLDTEGTSSEYSDTYSIALREDIDELNKNHIRTTEMTTTNLHRFDRVMNKVNFCHGAPPELESTTQDPTTLSMSNYDLQDRLAKDLPKVVDYLNPNQNLDHYKISSENYQNSGIKMHTSTPSSNAISLGLASALITIGGQDSSERIDNLRKDIDILAHGMSNALLDGSTSMGYLNLRHVKAYQEDEDESKYQEYPIPHNDENEMKQKVTKTDQQLLGEKLLEAITNHPTTPIRVRDFYNLYGRKGKSASTTMKNYFKNHKHYEHSKKRQPTNHPKSLVYEPCYSFLKGIYPFAMPANSMVSNLDNITRSTTIAGMNQMSNEISKFEEEKKRLQEFDMILKEPKASKKSSDEEYPVYNIFIVSHKEKKSNSGSKANKDLKGEETEAKSDEKKQKEMEQLVRSILADQVRYDAKYPSTYFTSVSPLDFNSRYMIKSTHKSNGYHTARLANDTTNSNEKSTNKPQSSHSSTTLRTSTISQKHETKLISNKNVGKGTKTTENIDTTYKLISSIFTYSTTTPMSFTYFPSQSPYNFLPTSERIMSDNMEVSSNIYLPTTSSIGATYDNKEVNHEYLSNAGSIKEMFPADRGENFNKNNEIQKISTFDDSALLKKFQEVEQESRITTEAYTVDTITESFPTESFMTENTKFLYKKGIKNFNSHEGSIERVTPNSDIVTRSVTQTKLGFSIIDPSSQKSTSRQNALKAINQLNTHAMNEHDLEYIYIWTGYNKANQKRSKRSTGLSSPGNEDVDETNETEETCSLDSTTSDPNNSENDAGESISTTEAISTASLNEEIDENDHVVKSEFHRHPQIEKLNRIQDVLKENDNTEKEDHNDTVNEEGDAQDENSNQNTDPDQDYDNNLQHHDNCKLKLRQNEDQINKINHQYCYNGIRHLLHNPNQNSDKRIGRQRLYPPPIGRMEHNERSPDQILAKNVFADKQQQYAKSNLLMRKDGAPGICKKIQYRFDEKQGLANPIRKHEEESLYSHFPQHYRRKEKDSIEAINNDKSNIVDQTQRYQKEVKNVNPDRYLKQNTIQSDLSHTTPYTLHYVTNHFQSPIVGFVRATPVATGIIGNQRISKAGTTSQHPTINSYAIDRFDDEMRKLKMQKLEDEKRALLEKKYYEAIKNGDLYKQTKGCNENSENSEEDNLYHQQTNQFKKKKINEVTFHRHPEQYYHYLQIKNNQMNRHQSNYHTNKPTKDIARDHNHLKQSCQGLNHRYLQGGTYDQLYRNQILKEDLNQKRNYLNAERSLINTPRYKSHRIAIIRHNKNYYSDQNTDDLHEEPQRNIEYVPRHYKAVYYIPDYQHSPKSRFDPQVDYQNSNLKSVYIAEHAPTLSNTEISNTDIEDSDQNTREKSQNHEQLVLEGAGPLYSKQEVDERFPVHEDRINKNSNIHENEGISIDMSEPDKQELGERLPVYDHELQKYHKKDLMSKTGRTPNENYKYVKITIPPSEEEEIVQIPIHGQKQRMNHEENVFPNRRYENRGSGGNVNRNHYTLDIEINLNSPEFREYKESEKFEEDKIKFIKGLCKLQKSEWGKTHYNEISTTSNGRNDYNKNGDNTYRDDTIKPNVQKYPIIGEREKLNKDRGTDMYLTNNDEYQNNSSIELGEVGSYSKDQSSQSQRTGMQRFTPQSIRENYNIQDDQETKKLFQPKGEQTEQYKQESIKCSFPNGRKLAYMGILQNYGHATKTRRIQSREQKVAQTNTPASTLPATPQQPNKPISNQKPQLTTIRDKSQYICLQQNIINNILDKKLDQLHNREPKIEGLSKLSIKQDVLEKLNISGLAEFQTTSAQETRKVEQNLKNDSLPSAQDRIQMPVKNIVPNNCKISNQLEEHQTINQPSTKAPFKGIIRPAGEEKEAHQSLGPLHNQELKIIKELNRHPDFPINNQPQEDDEGGQTHISEALMNKNRITDSNRNQDNPDFTINNRPQEDDEGGQTHISGVDTNKYRITDSNSNKDSPDSSFNNRPQEDDEGGQTHISGVDMNKNRITDSNRNQDTARVNEIINEQTGGTLQDQQEKLDVHDLHNMCGKIHEQPVHQAPQRFPSQWLKLADEDMSRDNVEMKKIQENEISDVPENVKIKVSQSDRPQIHGSKQELPVHNEESKTEEPTTCDPDDADDEELLLTTRNSKVRMYTFHQIPQKAYYNLDHPLAEEYISDTSDIRRVTNNFGSQNIPVKTVLTKYSNKIPIKYVIFKTKNRCQRKTTQSVTEHFDELANNHVRYMQDLKHQIKEEPTCNENKVQVVHERAKCKEQDNQKIFKQLSHDEDDLRRRGDSAPNRLTDPNLADIMEDNRQILTTVRDSTLAQKAQTTPDLGRDSEMSHHWYKLHENYVVDYDELPANKYRQIGKQGDMDPDEYEEQGQGDIREREHGVIGRIGTMTSPRPENLFQYNSAPLHYHNYKIPRYTSARSGNR